jgi:hypothetical protein
VGSQPFAVVAMLIGELGPPARPNWVVDHNLEAVAQAAFRYS